MAEIDDLMNRTVDFDASVDDVSAFRDPITQNAYVLMDDAYKGTGGFRDGSYLIPYGREMFYNMRRQFSTYKNYIKPIFNAMIEPIFADEIPRTYPENGLFSYFVEDVDNNGTSLQDTMNEAMQITVRQGQVFVIMDNFEEDDMPATLQEARQDRKFPYILLKTALDLDSYKLDKWGNIEEITFIDAKIEILSKEIQTYRKWDSQASYILKKIGDGKYEVLKTISHNLGVIPVIACYRNPRMNKQELLIDPPYYDMMRLALSIYNKDSELRDLERSQTFSLLVVQSDRSGNLNIGRRNVIFVRSDTTITPAYISPNPQISIGLMASIDKATDDLYKLAEQSGVTAVRTESSGVSEAFKFFGHETVLRKISNLSRRLEEAIAHLFSIFTGENLDEYTADYPVDFAPGSITSEVDMMDKYLKMDPPKKAYAMALEKVTRLVLSDQDQKKLEEAIDQIQEEGENEPEPTPIEPIGETGIQGETGSNGFESMGETGIQGDE